MTKINRHKLKLSDNDIFAGIRMMFEYWDASRGRHKRIYKIQIENSVNMKISFILLKLIISQGNGCDHSLLFTACKCIQIMIWLKNAYFINCKIYSIGNVCRTFSFLWTWKWIAVYFVGSAWNGNRHRCRSIHKLLSYWITENDIK